MARTSERKSMTRKKARVGIISYNICATVSYTLGLIQYRVQRSAVRNSWMHWLHVSRAADIGAKCCTPHSTWTRFSLAPPRTVCRTRTPYAPTRMQHTATGDPSSVCFSLKVDLFLFRGVRVTEYTVLSIIQNEYTCINIYESCE